MNGHELPGIKQRKSNASKGMTGLTKEQRKMKRLKLQSDVKSFLTGKKVDPDAPGTPGEPGYEPRVEGTWSGNKKAKEKQEKEGAPFIGAIKGVMGAVGKVKDIAGKAKGVIDKVKSVIPVGGNNNNEEEDNGDDTDGPIKGH